jgi:uncharacterized protein
MSEIYTYPGIYLTEKADIPRTVTAATTSLVAIMGIFPRGPADQAVLVSSQADFEAQFGNGAVTGLAASAVQQYFLNGGNGAWIVRLTANGSASAKADLAGISLVANSPGAWANDFKVALTPPALPDPGTFLQLIVTRASASGGADVPVEQISNLPGDKPAQLAAVINSASRYVTATLSTPVPASIAATSAPQSLAGGDDGTWDPTAFRDAVYAQLNNPEPAAAPDTEDGQGGSAAASGQSGGSASPSGGSSTRGRGGSSARGSSAPAGQPAPVPAMPLLDLIAPQVFNLLCIPDLVWLGPDQADAVQVAHKYAADHQAFLIVDPPPPSIAVDGTLRPPWSSSVTIVPIDNAATQLKSLAGSWGGSGATLLNATNDSGAVYYPWLIIPDPAQAGAQVCVPPSGTVAGIYAATDATRGVWKAPAGVDAALVGVNGLADTSINDTVNGTLNILGINVIRTFPIYGTVVWGSRTLAGSDLADSAWKYVPVRRLTDFIEQSLLQSLRWAIFEPNGPSLWGTISLEVGAFMSGLYSQGAFSGATAAQAYQVLCDATTTSAADMLSGIVRVQVGFQPVEPAEFVVLNIVLNAGTATS